MNPSLNKPADDPVAGIAMSEAPRGRPLGFGRDELVEDLMRAFWELGWRGASIPVLEQRTGVARSSLANTIGPKSDLFLAALDRYLEIVDDRLFSPLRDGTDGTADVRRFFQRLRELKGTEPGSWGCLMAIAMTEVGVGDPGVAQRTLAYRQRLRAALSSALERGEKSGEVRSGRATSTATALTAITIGLNVIVRAGASAIEIEALIDSIDEILDEISATPAGTD